MTKSVVYIFTQRYGHLIISPPNFYNLEHAAGYSFRYVRFVAYDTFLFALTVLLLFLKNPHAVVINLKEWNRIDST